MNSTIERNRPDTDIHDPSSEGFSKERTDEQLLLSYREGGDSVVFAGSLPPAVLAQHLREMIGICSGQGAKVYLDAKGEILHACADIADVIKPNVDELREMLKSSSQDMNDLLAQLRKSRKEASLVTCGANGAYYVTGNSCIHAALDGPPLQPVSSVGCGDAFLAGFIHCIEIGKTEEEALRRAVACGAACLLSPTTDIGDPDCVTKLEGRITCG